MTGLPTSTTPSPASASGPDARRADVPPRPLAADVGTHWLLDPDVAFLNHGCFGARPRAVLEHQSRLREEFERHPLEFLERRRDGIIADARRAVAKFVNADPDGLVFVTNATAGVNAVVRSLRFEPGDELLTTNHVYNAVRMTMRALAKRIGVTYREIDVPLPLRDPQEVLDAVDAGLTDRTRLLIADDVSSFTAVRFPIAEICRHCADRGVDVLVDGAHAPGMVEVNVDALNAAYYVGNLHKWVCAPVGAAFLWARADRRDDVHPPVISHFLDQGLAAEFNWQGTRDITPWLCAPEAIRWIDAQWGWDAVRAHNHHLAMWAQRVLSERWDVEPSTPPDGSMLGSMTTVAVPESVVAKFETAAALQAHLLDRHRLEVPVMEWREAWWIRPSCQVYNRADELERLADAVAALR